MLAYDATVALRALRRKDPRLAALIAQVGPFRLQLRDRITPFQALLRSIVYQQLSGKSASAIYGRVLDLFPGRYPSPGRLLALDDGALRSAGLSRAKVAASQDLALKFENGTLPSTRKLKTLPDEEIIDCLQQVRGIGTWTAQMLLIFYLGRPDVLPASDLGVLKGLRYAYGMEENPTPAELLEHGENWRPFRTVATWYLWRANYL